MFNFKIKNMKRLLIIISYLLFTISVYSQSGNTATGYNALYSNTTGSGNTAMGSEALRYNTIGSYNSAYGGLALGNNVSGIYNTATGIFSLLMNTSGSENTATGKEALRNNTTGCYNTAVGSGALQWNVTGNYNTAIGYGAGVTGSNLFNTTAIGNGAQVTANNQVRIGNSSVTSIGGLVGWSNLSDGRTKKNVQQNVPGLAFINKLQPVTYNFDLDAADYLLRGDKVKDMLSALSTEEKDARDAQQKRLYTGFVAQEVEKTAQSVGYDFSGVDKDERGIYSLRYSEFAVPLVKAVQELSEQHDTLQNQVNKLTELVNQLSEEEINPFPANINKTISNISSTSNISSASNVSLEQNSPNPFNHATTIRYTLPSSYQSATIVVNTITGKIVRQIPISYSGSGSIEFKPGHLPNGIYYYTLYVNNTLVDSKKMILKK